MWPGCLFGGAAVSLICCEAISYFLRTAAMVRLVLIVVIMVVVRMVLISDGDIDRDTDSMVIVKVVVTMQ